MKAHPATIKRKNPSLGTPSSRAGGACTCASVNPLLLSVFPAHEIKATRNPHDRNYFFYISVEMLVPIRARPSQVVNSTQKPLGNSRKGGGLCAGHHASKTSSLKMEEFQVPEDVGDPSSLQVETAGRFCASKDLPSLRDEGASELNDRLDGVGSRLANNGTDCLSEQDNFDEMFSFVRYVVRWRSWKGGVVGVVLLSRLLSRT